MSDQLGSALAETLRGLRTARGLTGAALAERAGVSRAMISRIEHGDVQPTAVLLGRLSAALGITLSELIARAEHEGRRLARAADQPVWTDPETGYRRRALSPRPGGVMELIEVELPPGARVAYPADAYALRHHQIWVIEGDLAFTEGSVEHRLGAGDCLELGAPVPCVYHNPAGTVCRYLVALASSRP
ncbi:XRE family transcriptional regulator [Nocardiopsis sp. EMB25]|uniref:helix-turn-helix domain-containing protein n=1 Tax=Nocardiopsis sp. EMB25 TaxID=2835867 RepID=UPI002284B64B|nr:XRE family transcriptional regulator [Nocardiopsis sp. EMB25]MCY9783781.1 XRE family transcriptional regulator [Nocardiopsis sp. EMB25]